MTARLNDMGKSELTELANAGIYDAVNARHIRWAELKGSSVVTMYRSNQFGFGLKAFMIGDSSSLFIEE